MRKPFARTLVAGCVHCGWQRACAAARWRVYGAGVGTARRASGLLALAAPPANPQKRLRSTARSLDRPRDRGRVAPPRLGNRGSLPSNAVDHVACWRCVPVVPGRGGMCAVPAAHLARRMLQQLPGRAREQRPTLLPYCDFFAKQRIFLGGNRASRDPGRRNGGVMRNPNYTYADTRQPSPDDEGQQESPHLSI